MIKLQALENFTLARYNELENIKRKSINTEGKLYAGDIFECNKELADYLLGANHLGKAVVEVIEIVPETKIEYLSEPEEPYAKFKVEAKPKKKKTSKK